MPGHPKIAETTRYWLDNHAQAARAGKTWNTLTRWMTDPRYNYPRPEKWFGKTPMTRLSTIEAWEASLPSEPPEQRNIRPTTRQRAPTPSVQPAE